MIGGSTIAAQSKIQLDIFMVYGLYSTEGQLKNQKIENFIGFTN